jgi:hypothetical protein
MKNRLREFFSFMFEAKVMDRTKNKYEESGKNTFSLKILWITHMALNYDFSFQKSRFRAKKYVKVGAHLGAAAGQLVIRFKDRIV